MVIAIVIALILVMGMYSLGVVLVKLAKLESRIDDLEDGD